MQISLFSVYDTETADASSTEVGLLTQNQSSFKQLLILIDEIYELTLLFLSFL